MQVFDAELGRDGAGIRGDGGEGIRIESGEIDLVDREDHVRHAQQRDDGEVTAGLLHDALAGVDENDDRVGRRRAGDHVARVLHVSGAVGEDERPSARREVAVGDVDRDALLALGAQAVGQQGEVELAVREAAVGRRAGDLLELVGEDRLRVVQQSADERRLAVVDRSRCREAEQRGLLARRRLAGEAGRDALSIE